MHVESITSKDNVADYLSRKPNVSNANTETESTSHIGSTKYLFYGKCFKKTTEYFLKFFLFQSTILPVNNGK